MSSDSAASRRRLAVLISGSGTNLQALIDAQNTPALPDTSIVLVLSNRKAAHGLVRASTASPPIPTAYLALQPYLRHNPGKTREDYDLELARIVLRAQPDVVVLAGWMHIVSELFLEALRGSQRIEDESQGPGEKNSNDDENPVSISPIPVINIHPALPGQFDGANAIQRGYEAFQRGEVDRLGVMVHRVVAEVDRGEPLIVREVPIEKGESIEVYEEQLHRVEWEIIVQATRKVLDEVKPLPPEGIDSV
ncbi:formyl transferase-domain-containing protein [Pisolithus croceorrhizus]|nr:formyl transferase-domain-containing protein [Pisolithus croceorrhizus]KAI6130084.1 formyl transferase-domain-containing protein [Pisolithus croceorrhizus]